MGKTLNLTINSSKLFFGDEGQGIARYDKPRYIIFQKLNEKMQSFFWRPVEIDVSMEKKDFDKMTDTEQFFFTANLRRQILLDSIQGRAPSLTFLEHCTDSDLENCILTWSFFESIHNESYTHIIRAIYPDPSPVFDEIPGIEQIADCAKAITYAYDLLRDNPNKENLYLALVTANALEALRFYVSFACTFSFAERGLVEGSAKVIRFIARDEFQHLALVQQILKILPYDDPDFVQIIGDNNQKAIDIFNEATEQERDWIDYLFSNGTILGLNKNILNDYLSYLLSQRLINYGVKSSKHISHPLPWVEKWFTNSNIQVAPQEVEVASYLTSSIVNDIENFNFEL